MVDVPTPTPTSDDVAERVLASALGAIDTLSIALGDRLGWYDALAQRGACTPEDLASATGTSTRYAREWLEQHATTGLLEVEEGDPSCS